MDAAQIAALVSGITDQIGLFLTGGVALIGLVWGVPTGFRLIKRLAK